MMARVKSFLKKDVDKKRRGYYTKVNNIHMIYDYYTKEESKLIINTNYLLIKSTKQIPTFLKAITRKEKIFVIDFDNIDYFWLEELL
jgi:sporulation protein YlmC with PRC-barrel domain